MRIAAAGRGMAAAGLALVGVGCGPEFTPRALVDELRILAVQAEPPEVAPGEEVTYRALVVHPEGEGALLVYGFVQCTPTLGGCLELVEAEAEAGGDPELAQDLYLETSMRFGAAPVVDGVIEALGANLRAPTSLLAGVEDPAEGANAQLSFFVCEAERCLASGLSEEAGGSPGIPEGAEVALKRVRVSTGEAPNHNPTVARLEIATGAAAPTTLEAGDEGVVPAGGDVELTAFIPRADVEPYQFTSDDGLTEARDERLYVGWYATAGEFAYNTSLVDAAGGAEPSASVVWTLPAAGDVPGGLVDIYVVVWDRRGGLGWITASIILEP